VLRGETTVVEEVENQGPKERSENLAERVGRAQSFLRIELKGCPRLGRKVLDFLVGNGSQVTLCEWEVGYDSA
jgi:hypothetical protein